MAIRLRGHHLFCLLGYRGKGYSEEFCANMTAVYETLRTKPDTVVELVRGPDDMCKAYPPDKPNHCENESVYRKDRNILRHLGLDTGMSKSWSDILRIVSERAVPEDIGRLCAGCPWLPLGYCQEGVDLVRSEGRLPMLPGGPG